MARTGPVDARRADQPGAELPDVGRAAERRRRPERQGHEADDRAGQLGRPQRHRDLRAQLREADGQRQGRPGAGALGQRRQLRGRAAGQPLRLPLPGADRAVAPAGRDEAAVLLPDAAAAQGDVRCAGRPADGQRREERGRDLHRRTLRPGELRRLQGGAAGHGHQHGRGQELLHQHQGSVAGAARHQGQEPRCLRRLHLPGRYGAGQPPEQGDRLQPEVLLPQRGHRVPVLPRHLDAGRRGRRAGHGLVEPQDQQTAPRPTSTPT